MKKNAFVIDDSSSMRDIVKFCLEQEKYQVFEAENGVDALNKLNNGLQIEFFIVDINMPIMDGITLVKKLRENTLYQRTPIVMLTTESQPHKKMEAKTAGATGWISKPFQPNTLMEVINSLTAVSA